MKKFLLTICAAIIFFASTARAEELPFVDNFILWTENRDELIDEYTLRHYGKLCREIVPQAVVVHWTAFGTLETNWKYFYAEETDDDEGKLNVASQFIVDRDGNNVTLHPVVAPLLVDNSNVTAALKIQGDFYDS